MSHYLHHVIEVKKDGKWQTLETLAYPGSYIKNEHPERIIKVNDTEMYFASEFITSFLMLRDNYFGYSPWRKDNCFSHGLPADADEKTIAITKEYVDGHFNMYNCTIEDIDKEAENIYKELREIQKKEDLMNYSTEFARRLGFCGKEEPDYNYADDAKERIEDLEITYTQLRELSGYIEGIAESVFDEYWLSTDNIRIISWTD